MSAGEGAPQWLLFGLGNPGARYERTRHNLGWRLADLLAQRHGVAFSAGRGEYFMARYPLDGRSIRLIKPTTWMNLSGRAVRQYLAIERPEDYEMVIAIDDVHLPLGSLRYRTGGSAGGHNGLRSVLESLRTEEVPRLRMGVGPGPQGADLADFVLEEFEADEQEAVDAMLLRAADAFEFRVTHDPQETMARFNG